MTTLKLTDSKFASFYNRVKNAFDSSAVTKTVNGKTFKGFPPGKNHPVWLRDHTYQMRGFRYFEPDLKSVIEVFAANQDAKGGVFDYFTKENTGKRVPCEADLEFLLVEAVYQTWQATGDDAWMVSLLPHLEKGMHYAMTDEQRWSKEHQLVKRPFTVDTWDFAYNPQGKYAPHSYRDIDENTSWCIMHGDNTGMFKAASHLACLYRHSGDSPRSEYWRKISAGFKERTNKLCWNGRFYTHQIHINPVNVEGVDEKEQLSLSNAFNLNRGIVDFEQRCSIIEEYRRHKKNDPKYFAEWFGIHPPFPPYSFHPKGQDACNPGSYVNGGVLPLVGGELARGAFENGFEDYGLEILDCYFRLVETTGAYVWYFPDGRPGTGFKPPDVWGLSAMLAAMIEGLLGVRDEHKLFEKVMFSPRLVGAGINQGSARIEYPASGACFDYEYLLKPEEGKLSLNFNGNHTETVGAHVLLPKGKKGVKVFNGNEAVAFENKLVRQSPYVNFTTGNNGKITIEYR